MKRLTVRRVSKSSKVYDAAHTLLGNAVGLVFLTALSFPVSSAQETAQLPKLSKPPEIHVSIPDGAEYWVMQPHEDGSDEWSIWSRYEWNTELLNGYWYEGYEFESTMTWRNLAVGLLAGDFLVADLWIDVWGWLRDWDRCGVYVGERFNPAKVKRLAHGLQENSVWLRQVQVLKRQRKRLGALSKGMVKFGEG